MSEAIVISDDKKVESKYFTYKDLQDVIKRGGKGMDSTKAYNPKEFWDSMGEKFYRAFDKTEKCSFGVDFFVDRLKIMQPIESVLEVGCGFGRVAPFILQAGVASSYKGIDISESILKCSEQYLEPVIKETKDIDAISAFMSNGALSEESKRLIAEDVNKIIKSLESKASEKSKKPVDFRDKISVGLGDVRNLSEIESESFDCVISNETIQHLNPTEAIEACGEVVRVSKKYAILLERWAFPGEHSEPHIWSHNYSEIFNDLGVEVLQVTTIAQGLQGVVVRKR